MRKNRYKTGSTITHTAGMRGLLLGIGLFLAAGLAPKAADNTGMRAASSARTFGDGMFCMLTEASEVETKSIASEEEARAYIEQLLTGDAQALMDTYLYTEEMEEAISKSGGMAMLRISFAMLGEVKKIHPAVRGEQSGYIYYRVPCEFALTNLDFVISLDQEMRIAGLVTAEYSGVDEEELTEAEEGDGAGESVALEDTTEAEDRKYEEISLALPTAHPAGGSLPGTLLLPEGEGPFAAIVLVHGSGPNDRNETIGPNAPFRDIAEGLAEKGIAVYRYDKGSYVYGEEIAAETDYTLKEETVDDAAAAVALLSEQEQIDPDRIYVLGHSLGGMALPAIYEEATQAGEAIGGCIFLAAPARGLPEIMKEQIEFLYSLMSELTEAQEEEKNALYQELEKLSDLDALQEDDQVLGAYKAYWEALEEYDYLSMARDITAPCLVLQGEEDYQVTMEDYRIWQKATEGQDNWEFHSYPGLTHLFIPGEKAEGNQSYGMPGKVDRQVIEDIAEFVK